MPVLSILHYECSKNKISRQSSDKELLTETQPPSIKKSATRPQVLTKHWPNTGMTAT